MILDINYINCFTRRRIFLWTLFWNLNRFNDLKALPVIGHEKSFINFYSFIYKSNSVANELNKFSFLFYSSKMAKRLQFFLLFFSQLPSLIPHNFFLSSLFLTPKYHKYYLFGILTWITFFFLFPSLFVCFFFFCCLACLFVLLGCICISVAA